MLIKSNNGLASASEARYLPFGGWRTTPSQTISERAYTGQLENMELGLYYYNARYYVAGIGRFARVQWRWPWIFLEIMMKLAQMFSDQNMLWLLM